MGVSMTDISRACGVSRQTVGCILNGQGNLFRHETQRKVWQTAERLGYRKNATARAMRLGRQNCIALLLGRLKQTYLPEELLHSLNLAADRRNFHITLTELAGFDLSCLETAPKQLKEVLADGYLIDFTPAVPPQVLALVEQTRLPYLCLNTDQPVGSVFPDDRQGGRLATAHLLELGHRCIAFVSLKHSGGQHYSDGERLAGYQDAMRAAGLSPRILVAPADLSPRQRIQTAAEFLAAAAPPEAIVAYSSPTAVALQIAAMTLSLDIPRDLSLVTIDDYPYFLTGLTFDTLLLPWPDVAEIGLEQLLRRVEEPQSVPVSVRVPYRELRRGESCLPARRTP